MSQIAHLIEPFITHFGVIVLFLVAFLETLPFLGMIVPGATIIIISGYLIKLGFFSFSTVFVSVLLGAFLGDLMSYWLGRKKGYDFLKRFGKYIFLTETRLEQARALVKKHTAYAILFGRFNTLTRSLSAFISGASHVRASLFVVLTFFSVFIWTLLHLLVGFIFGEWIEQIIRYLGLFLFVVIVLISFFIYGYRELNKRYHLFKRVETQMTILLIGAVLVFSFLIQEVITKSFVVEIDRAVADLVQTVSSPILSFIMLSVTRFCDPSYIILFSSIFIVYLFFKKKFKYIALGTTSLFLGGVSVFYIKNMTNIMRPEHPVIPTLYSSFPSGHSVFAMIFGLFIMICFRNSFEEGIRRQIFLGTVSFFIIFVGMSRIYLGAHWASDVLAGFSLGMMCVFITLLLFRFVAFIKKLI